ncbi:hypothetical protein [Lacrimispora sp.]|jgi:hypothetical protein|uniref:hypothetical protein n=1 Tax=Lacrimispora sp. TaxID=2719234 RepID=UPI0028AE4039|nr:hypothetical protein [Lacrimispora sp.]
MRKFNKEKFLKTDFGSELESTVRALDFYLSEKSKISQWKEPEKYRARQKDIDKLFAQWEVYKLAVKQFYGVEYSFTRTDEYCGCCTEDESDWLFKVDRELA